LFFIIIGVALGLVAGFIPGFSSENLSLLIVTYGIISTNYYLVVTVIAVEISYSFFSFLSPMIFSIGNDATSLAIDNAYSGLTEDSLKRGMEIVASGGLVGILISLPLLFFAEDIYPLVYNALRPLVGWILLLLCSYMIWIERGWKGKFFAAIIFCLSGLVGLFARGSGLVPSEYLLVPIFIGLYGFSSLVSKRYRENSPLQDIALVKKVRVAAIAFITSMFASFVTGMKRGQTSALALRIGGISKREEVLFILSAISLSFTTLSIFVLSSVGKVRSTLAYDIQEIMGDIYFSQTVLFVGSVIVSACISVCVLILLAKPLGRILSRINGKYLKVFGFCVGVLLIVNFTGVYGIVLAFTTTCIGILSSRLRVRSTHLMGVLLLPSIVAMIL
jgi:putative membrane protein